jgi:sugar-specific transcriptional regulator TrmB
MSSDERTREGLVDRFQELGLTEYEARTLVALVRLGTGTAREVAEVEEVPRSRVYDAAETLHRMGLVDIQHTSPQQYTAASRSSIVETFDRDRREAIRAVADLLERLEDWSPEVDRIGTWTVSGGDAVGQRVMEFLGEAENRLVYLAAGELLADDHLEALEGAADRGVEVYLGDPGAVDDRVRTAVPSATLLETPWTRAETPTGRLLVGDDRWALVSVRADAVEAGGSDEIAIWGSGRHNSLVVTLGTLLGWWLDDPDDPAAGTEEVDAG